jgi:hypothetical protein
MAQWLVGLNRLLSHKELQITLFSLKYIQPNFRLKVIFIGAVPILKLFSLRNSYGLVAYYFCGGGNFVSCCHIHNPELPIKSVNIYEGI